MTSKAKNKLINKATLYDGMSVPAVNFAKDAVRYEKRPSHLHQFKVQPIPDGNRAERRAAKKRKKKC